MTPPGWTSVVLADIADVRAGDGFPPDRQGRADGDVPFFKVGDISTAVQLGESTLLRARNFVSHEDVRELKLHVMPVDTVLFAKIGAAIGLNRRGIAGVPMVVDNNVMGVIPARFIEPRFVYWFMRTVKLERLAQATTVPSIRKSDVLQIPVELPPRNEQRRIVAKLDAVFAQTRAAKARLERLPALIEKLKRSILAAAFRGDLTADWRAANPDVDWADDLSACDSTDTLPAIPSTWRWAPLGALTSRIEAGASFKCDERPPGDDEIGVAKISAVTWGEYDESESKTCMDAARVAPDLFIKAGDFLLSRANTISLVGACVIATEARRQVMLSDKILRLRFEGAPPHWVLYALRSPWGRSEIERLATGNQESMRNIGQDRLRQVRILVAPAAEMALVVERVRALLLSGAALLKRIHTLTASLARVEREALAKAFRGELVPQDPADEPAEVLLERIRAAKAEEAPVVRRPRAAAATTYAAPPVTLAQAAESGPLFKHALDRQARAAGEPAALDLVVAALQQSDGRLTAAAIAQATGLDPAAIRVPLKELVAAGQVRTHGKARGTTYEWIA